MGDSIFKKLNEYILPAIGACILLIFVFIVTICVLVIINRKGTGKMRDTCYATECLTRTTDILNFLDENTPPCVNFYEFVCGGWIEKHVVRNRKTEITTAETMSLSQAEDARKLLGMISSTNAQTFQEFLRIFYRSCTREEDYRSGGNACKYFDSVFSIVGNWRILAGTSSPHRDFEEYSADIFKEGLGNAFLINFAILPSLYNSTQNKITLLLPSFIGYDETFYHDDNGRKKEETYFRKFVDCLKDQNPNLNEEDVREIFQFEFSLFKTTVGETLNLKNIKFYNVRQMNTTFPTIKWKKYFKEILGNDIDERETIQIIYPEQLKKMNTLLERFENRNILNIKVTNYLFWRVYESILSTTMLGKSDCPYIVSRELHIAFAALYVRSRFQNNGIKKMTSDIVHYIQRNTISLLKQNKLMTPSIRNFTVRKIKNIDIEFPFANELFNDTKVNQYYIDLDITISQDFWKNLQNIQKWKFKNSLLLLKTPNIRKDWKHNIAAGIDTAKSDVYANRIVISPTFASNPLFGEYYPNYLNFGGIGSIIGREFMRAIFPPGNQIGVNGGLQYWWDNKTSEMYETPQLCIKKQYDEFRLPGSSKTVNGTITLNENFLDNAGYSLAYNAYISWQKDHGEEVALPGVKYTDRQLFWISLASTQCSKYNLGETEKFSSDVRSPGIFRILGALSNNEDFSRDFKCSLTSPMNPEKKCRVFG